MLHLLGGTKIAAGLVLATSLFIALWRWEVSGHDHTKKQLAAQELAAIKANDAVKRLADLASQQNKALLERAHSLQENQLHIQSLKTQLDKQRTILARDALKAPFRLGGDQRRDLMRILCDKPACGNSINTDTASPDASGSAQSTKD